MHKKTATTLIIGQKDKFLKPMLNEDTWKIQTLNIIESIFGEDSREVMFVKSYRFEIVATTSMSQKYIRLQHQANTKKIRISAREARTSG